MTENTFVIRIWCEHSEQESVKPQFRGVIKHVISGQREYLNDTRGICNFIQNHLPNKSDNKKQKAKPHSIAEWFKR